MKNIMVFDDCQDYFYDIHSVSSEDFALIFPGAQQDIEFNDDLYKRLNNNIDAAFCRMWNNRRRNQGIEGLHGILFYENFDRKPFYPDKRDIADARTTLLGL